MSERNLTGLTVLVSRPADQLTEFIECADKNMVKVIPFPLLTLEATINQYDVGMVAADLRESSWLLFTSANGVDFYFDHLNRHAIVVPPDIAIGAIGRKTAIAVENQGFRVALRPKQEVAEGLLAEFLSMNVSRDRIILLPSAEEVRPVLVEGLTEAGYRVKKLDIYRAIETPKGKLPVIAGRQIDYSCFTSSAAVKRYDVLFGEPKGPAVSLGPITTAKMKEHGWDNIIELPESDLNRFWEIVHG